MRRAPRLAGRPLDPTLFFIVAQLINLVFFQVRPDLPLFVGGVMIAGGGLVITLWKP